MTHIKVDQSHTDDDRWLEAGADAFALHVAAMVYSDRQLLDGYISRAMALRVCLAVSPETAGHAIEALVDTGFWELDDKGYRIVQFHEHALPADQVARTRERWRIDKERRRQHLVGDHALCKDPKFCPAIRSDSTPGSTVDSTGGGSHLYPTQPNQTQPDRREGVGDGTAGPGPALAGAPPADAAEEASARLGRLPHVWSGDCCPLPEPHPIHRSAS